MEIFIDVAFLFGGLYYFFRILKRKSLGPLKRPFSHRIKELTLAFLMFLFGFIKLLMEFGILENPRPKLLILQKNEMSSKELFRLCVPLLSIAFGVFLRKMI